MEELGVGCRHQSGHEDSYMDQPVAKPGFGSLSLESVQVMMG